MLSSCEAFEGIRGVLLAGEDHVGNLQPNECLEKDSVGLKFIYRLTSSEQNEAD